MGATWIAKPIAALNQSEIKLWKRLSHHNTPVSQTLAWGKSIDSIHGKSILVFSPERNISGLFMIEGSRAECVNGPVLDWTSIQDASSLNEQVSLVVYALHQSHPQTTEVLLRPRLLESQFKFLEQHLAFPIEQCDQAQTMTLALKGDEQSLFLSLPAKIRHEIKRAENSNIEYSVRDARENLENFWSRTVEFYQSKSLFIPPHEWIKSLITNSVDPISSSIITVRHQPSQSVSEIMILHLHGISFYFYAYEMRTESCPNISLNTYAQWQALCLSQTKGSHTYDLNGLLHPSQKSEDDHHYRGVDFYKRKFKGQELNYFSPLIQFGAT